MCRSEWGTEGSRELLRALVVERGKRGTSQTVLRCDNLSASYHRCIRGWGDSNTRASQLPRVCFIDGKYFGNRGTLCEIGCSTKTLLAFLEELRRSNEDPPARKIRELCTSARYTIQLSESYSNILKRLKPTKKKQTNKISTKKLQNNFSIESRWPGFNLFLQVFILFLHFSLWTL